MSVIAILKPSDVYDDDQIAPTHRRTPGPDGGHVPGRLAGYTHDGAAYCPECAGDVEVEAPDGEASITLEEYPAFETDPHGFGVGVVSGTDEWDFPGATCDVCGRTLDTNLLVYDDGGAYPTPVVEALDPDGIRTPAAAFLVEDPGDEEVRIMLAEDFGSHGDAGDMSWVPRTDVNFPEGYELDA